jgi:integrase
VAKNRRAKGEGSIFRRKDGYYVGSFEAGYRWSAAKGKMVRRQCRVVRKREADVVAALAELRRQIEAGTVPDRTRTVEQFLAWWLDNVAAASVGESTLTQYRTRVYQWIAPYIGHVKLYKLRQVHVLQMLAGLIADGKGNSARSQALTTLRQALQVAVDSDFLPKNVANGVTTPAPEAKTDDTPEADEVDAILAVAAGDRLYALAWLALQYGLRQGELLRLRWSDITADTLTIFKGKTRASKRTLPVIPEARVVLDAHRAAQAAERLAAESWADDDLVFTTEAGAPLDPRWVRGKWWKDGLLKGAGVRDCRFHAARHATATALFEMGLDIDTVAAILVHKSAATTRKVYLRIRADIQRRALAKVVRPPTPGPAEAARKAA